VGRIIFAQLRRRPGRALALLVGVLIASLGFTVLTASTQRSTLIVTGTVNENARGAYDILVRPAGTRTNLEEQRGLVRANFMSGLYGGITTDQWHRIQSVPGVEVAAPIAMVGYASDFTIASIDLTDAVDPEAETQLIRVRASWKSDAKLTSIDDVAWVAYVTKWEVKFADAYPRGDPNGKLAYADGRTRDASACGRAGEFPPYEVQPDGRERPICFADGRAGHVLRLLPNGTFQYGVEGVPTSRLTADIEVPQLMLVAAVDPTAEAQLVGLDAAIESGRALAVGESATRTDGGLTFIPALVANTPYLDETLMPTAEVARNPGIAGVAGAQAEQRIMDLPADRTVPLPGLSAEQMHRDFIGPDSRTGGLATNPDVVVRPGAPVFDDSGSVLRPHVADSVAEVWEPMSVHVSGPFISGVSLMPVANRDIALRPTQVGPGAFGGSSIVRIRSVGVFDPAKLRVGGEFALPADTYTTAQATGADDRSRALLKNQPLRPSSNAGGYLTASPTVLVPLSAYLPYAVNASDPLSAVRVRVAGVTGFDPVSREKVRLAAEDIAAATGLDVEVMLGASGAPQTIDLPAGKFGRPQLLLAENWAKKGVAAQIVQAVDRKSAVLFGLILVVCALFLTNAVGAGVADRRRDLAILACTGWSRWRLAGLVLGEVAIVGVVAGGLAAALAKPVAAVSGIGLPPGRAWLAIPVSMLLCVVAAMPPALRAGRTHPLRAVHAVTVRVRRARHARFVLAVALRNLRRVPGRTALGVLALAVGCAGLTLVLAITLAFHGTITGTVLGDAVSLRTRGVDLFAIAAVLMLSVGAVADVLYLNIRDRAGEFAALRAIGWSGAALTRLVVYEGLGIGLLGAAAGCGIGLAGAAWFTGAVSDSLLWTVALTAASGVGLAGLAAVVPALMQRRIPVARLLAAESA
jgi:hypothetical protein